MADENRDMVIDITAKDKTKAGISSARQGFNSLAKGLGIVGTAVGGLGLGLMVKQTLESVDATAKSADALGISTKALGGFHHLAGLTGGSVQGMNTSLQMMSRNVSDAAQGTGLAKDAIKALGLSAEELRQRGPEQAFIAIVGELENVESASDRTSIAMDIFGRSGASVLNITSEALADATAEADALGIAMSRADAAKIEAANDALLRMGGAVQGAVQTLTVELAPIITAVVDKFTEASKGAGGFKEEIIDFTEVALVGAARVGDVWHGWNLIFAGVKVTWQALIAGILTGFEAVDSGMTATINAGIGELNQLIETINQIPGVTVPLLSEVDPNETLAGMAALAREDLGMAVDDMQRLALQELPSDKIKAWISEVQAAAEVAAQAIEASTVGKIAGGIDAPSALGDEVEQDENEMLREKLAEQLEILLESQLAERDLLLVDFEEKKVMLDSALSQKLLSETDHADAMGRLQSDLQEGLTAIELKESLKRIKQAENEKRARVGTAENMANAFGTITQIVSNMSDSGNKKDFERNKKVNIANAIVNTYTGATKALASGGVWGIVQAALVIAYGLSQVSRIKSQSFEGGGSIAGAAAAPAIPEIPTQVFPDAAPVTLDTAVADLRDVNTTPTISYHVEVHGNIMDSDETARALIEPLEQARLDGVESEL